MYTATVKLPFPGMEMAITINYDGKNEKPVMADSKEVKELPPTKKSLSAKKDKSNPIPRMFQGDKVLASRFERSDSKGHNIHFKVPDAIGSYIDVSVNTQTKTVICYFDNLPNRPVDFAQHSIDGFRMVTERMGFHINGMIKVHYPIDKWGDYPLFYSDELMNVCNRICKCMHKAGTI